MHDLGIKLTSGLQDLVQRQSNWLPAGGFLPSKPDYAKMCRSIHVTQKKIETLPMVVGQTEKQCVAQAAKRFPES